MTMECEKIVRSAALLLPYSQLEEEVNLASCRSKNEAKSYLFYISWQFRPWVVVPNMELQVRTNNRSRHDITSFSKTGRNLLVNTANCHHIHALLCCMISSHRDSRWFLFGRVGACQTHACSIISSIFFKSF